MSEIRLTVHFPRQVTETARVDSADRVLDYMRETILRGLITGLPEDYSLYRNNNSLVVMSDSFAQAGFVPGDQLFIQATPAQGNSQESEVEEVEVSRTFHQLGILVLDGSGSMGQEGNGKISLANHVNKAVQEFIEAFKQNSSILPNVSLAIVTFDDQASIHTVPTPLEKMNVLGDYDPMRGHGGGTNIGAALEMAEKLAIEHLQGPDARNLPCYATIIVMTDGQCLHEDYTRQVVSRIKGHPLHENRKMLVCASFFKNIGISGASEIKATQLLQDLVSEQKLYDVSHDYVKLRQFFIGSMTAKRMHAK